MDLSVMLGNWSQQSLVGPNWVQETYKKVQEILTTLLAAQVDQRVMEMLGGRELQFAMGDQVLLIDQSYCEVWYYKEIQPKAH